MKFAESFATKTFIFGAIFILASVFAATPEEWPTVREVLTALAAILALASGRQAIGNAGRAKVLLALASAAVLSLGFTGTARADPPAITPYAGLGLDRLSGPDEWSTGLEVGAEATKQPLSVVGSITLHDIVSEHEAYPWDMTFKIAAGVYSGGHELLGIPIVPYAYLTLSRPSGPDEWSTGLSLGIEADLELAYLRVSNDWHDVLTTHEVYPWNSTLGLAVGIYFGGEDDRGAGPKQGRLGR